MSDSSFVLNAAVGGDGAPGGNGGNGQGGGLFNDASTRFSTSSLTLQNCLVTLNEADGGAEGTGGSDGQGIGGGVYNLGTLDLVMTLIALNRASTSNNDIFP